MSSHTRGACKSQKHDQKQDDCCACSSRARNQASAPRPCKWNAPRPLIRAPISHHLEWLESGGWVDACPLPTPQPNAMQAFVIGRNVI